MRKSDDNESGQAVEGVTGESPESRKQRVRGGQDAKGGKGESLGSRKQVLPYRNSKGLWVFVSIVVVVLCMLRPCDTRWKNAASS